MSDDTKTPVGLLICNFGKWWRHMKTKNCFRLNLNMSKLDYFFFLHWTILTEKLFWGELGTVKNCIHHAILECSSTSSKSGSIRILQMLPYLFRFWSLGHNPTEAIIFTLSHWRMGHLQFSHSPTTGFQNWRFEEPIKYWFIYAYRVRRDCFHTTQCLVERPNYFRPKA